jgi:hypothetical protein
VTASKRIKGVGLFQVRQRAPSRFFPGAATNCSDAAVLLQLKKLKALMYQEVTQCAASAAQQQSAGGQTRFLHVIRKKNT